MAEHINVGSVSVDVVPNTERFARDIRAKLDPEARKIGDELGKIMGDALSKSINDAVGRGLRDSGAGGTAAREGARTGKDFGDAFSRIAKAKIDAALKDLPKADLKIDSTKANARIAEMRFQLESLNEDIRLGVDDKEALARITALAEFMKRTLKDSADIRVKLDVGKALVELEALKAALGGLGSGGARGAGNTGSGGFFSGLSGLVDTGGAGLTPMTIAIAALIAMAPALYNAAAVIVAGIAGITAALSVATLGFAAFVGAGVLVFKTFLGHSSDYQTAVKAQQKARLALEKAQISAEFSLGFDKGGAKAPGAAAAALALAQKQGLGTKFLPAGLKPGEKASLATANANLQTANQQLGVQTKALGPGGVAVSNQWQALLKQFDKVTSQVAPLVYPAFSAGIRLIGTALQYLAPIVKAVSPVIVGMLNQAGRALASPQAKQFVDFIIKHAPGVIANIGQIIGNFFGSLPGFIERFTPIGERFFGWLRRVSGNLSQLWNSQGLKTFLSDVQADAPAVQHFFVQLGKLVGSILRDLQALQPLGTLILNTLSNVVIPVMIELGRAAVGLIGGLFIVLGKAVGGILTALADVASTLHLPFANALHDAANNVTAWTNGFQDQLKSLQGSLDTVSGKISHITGKNHFVDFTLRVNGTPVGIGATSASSGHPRQRGAGTTGSQFAGLTQTYGTAIKDAFKASGGWVVGPGTSTSDSVPLWASAHEFVVNAAAAQRNGALLEQINAGRDVQAASRHEAVFNVEGYGADQVAGLIADKQRALELLYGR